MIDDEGTIRRFIEQKVMNIHRRNGGSVEALDFSERLLQGTIGLDSIDLAEVIAELESKFCISIFEDRDSAPLTWQAIVGIIVNNSFFNDTRSRL
jgi:acyl carrier protein